MVTTVRKAALELQSSGRDIYRARATTNFNDDSTKQERLEVLRKTDVATPKLSGKYQALGSEPVPYDLTLSGLRGQQLQLNGTFGDKSLIVTTSAKPDNASGNAIVTLTTRYDDAETIAEVGLSQQTSASWDVVANPRLLEDDVEATYSQNTSETAAITLSPRAESEVTLSDAQTVGAGVGAAGALKEYFDEVPIGELSLGPIAIFLISVFSGLNAEA